MVLENKISGFRRGVTSSLFWYTKHSRLVVTDVSEQPIGFLYKRPWHFNMGPIGCPESSVTNYQSSLRNIPEEQRSPLFCDLRQVFTMKTARSVIMLYTVIFSCSFVCDLILVLLIISKEVTSVSHNTGL